MKHILIIIISGLSMFMTACDQKVQFSSKAITSLSPGVECVPGDPEFTVPSIVQRGRPFSAKFLRNNVMWTFSNTTGSVEVAGAEVTLALNELGNYNGLVVGINSCNKPDAREFDILVVEPIDGISIVINNNDIYTRQLPSQLSLTAQGATEMYVTNTPGCAVDGQWETYSNSKAWALLTRNAINNVYIKYRNPTTESPCVSDDITHDDIAPVVSFVTHPSGITNQNSAQFEFAATDNLSGVKSIYCQLDAGAFDVCGNQKRFDGLSDGNHTVSIYAEDNAGNISLTDSRSWTVDASAPVVQITRAPASPTTLRDAEFEFTVTEVGLGIVSVRCQLDGGPAVDCVSPISYSNLNPALHSFIVTAVDRAGNTGSASHRWEIRYNEIDETIPVTDGFGASDILFVVDNSSSMFSELRESISYRFARFAETLGTSNYRIGITTGDATGTREFEAGGLARILDRPVPGSGVSLVPAQYSVVPTMNRPDRYLIATLQRPEVICIAGNLRCPARANPYQQGIHSTLLALQRADTVAMLRPEAALNVVIISNKDEGNGNLTDSSGNVRPGTPDYNKPETLVNYVRTTFPEKTFKVHSIIRRPQDITCNSNDVDAEKAPLYYKLSQLTEGKTANICDDMDRDEINAIAEDIKSNSALKHKLRCVPLDTDGDGRPNITVTYEPNPSVPVNYTLDNDTIHFNPAPPVGTNIKLKYVCP